MRLIQTPQLRTGTNNDVVMPVTDDAVATSEQTTSFETLQKPAVWRHGRESATDTVRALEKNGMETYDIPAFLRRQAD